jgi:serine/threonine-protein kinase
MEDLQPRLNESLAGRYTLERELGRGGMALVYLATDVKHDRQVAVKVLLPELAATIWHERFLREIRIAAKLTHPHILPSVRFRRGGGPAVLRDAVHRGRDGEGPAGS